MLGHDCGCIVPSAKQTCQITLVVVGDALVLVAIRADGCHSVKLPEPVAVVPRHGGHVVAAAQTRLEVLGNTWR